MFEFIKQSKLLKTVTINSLEMKQYSCDNLTLIDKIKVVLLNFYYYSILYMYMLLSNLFCGIKHKLVFFRFCTWNVVIARRHLKIPQILFVPVL